MLVWRFSVLFVVASLVACSTMPRVVELCSIVGEPDYPIPTLECTDENEKERVVPVSNAVQEHWICHHPEQYKKLIRRK